jgi:hypothetical protein
VARSPAEALGPSYFDVYRGLNRPVDYEEFVTICRAQGLVAPTDRMFRHVRRLFRSRQPTYLSMNALDVELKNQRASWTVDRVEGLVDERRVETAHLEFKREPDGPGTTAKPWAAVANAGGGAVVYGIDEDDLSRASRAVPIDLDGLRERFEQINRAVDPPVDVTIEVLPIEPGERGYCVVVVGPAVPGRVHLVDHRAPTRDGTTTRYMTSEEVRRWIIESYGLAPEDPEAAREDEPPPLQLPLDE